MGGARTAAFFPSLVGATSRGVKKEREGGSPGGFGDAWVSISGFPPRARLLGECQRGVARAFK